jgi:hypothetical protein
MFVQMSSSSRVIFLARTLLSSVVAYVVKYIGVPDAYMRFELKTSSTTHAKRQHSHQLKTHCAHREDLHIFNNSVPPGDPGRVARGHAVA